MAVLWVANALVITSLFAFRAVDVARLAARRTSSAHRVGVTLGSAGLLVVAAGDHGRLVRGGAVLFASVLAACCCWTGRPMTTEVKERFTA